MNLIYLINQIGNILDYNPEIAEYREEMRNIINDIYLSMFSERPWRFAQKEIHLNVFGDVTLPVDTTEGSQVSILNDFNGAVGTGTGGYYAYLLCPEDDVPVWLSTGCIVTISSGTDSTNNDPLPNVPLDYWVTNITNGEGEGQTNKIRVWFKEWIRISRDYTLSMREHHV